MKLSKTVITALLASVLMFTLSACEEKGPAEETGEAIDDAVEDAGDKMEDATDGE